MDLVVRLTKNNPRQGLLKFGLWFLFIFMLASADAQVLWQSKHYIKKAFFEIAYKNEYKQGLRKLTRWNKPIQYKIDYFKFPAVFEVAEKLIDDHFRDLSDISALSIVKSDKNPNFRIILTKRAHYKEAIDKYSNIKIKNIEIESNCLLYIKHLNNQLVKASVIIPVDHAMRYGLLPACIVEELTQAMGLPNDSDWVSPSVANDISVLDLLTGLDYLMLKILYDKRLEIGMSVEQSDTIVDEILLDFEQKNLIKGAALEAKKLRLSRQLDEL